MFRNSLNLPDETISGDALYTQLINFNRRNRTLVGGNIVLKENYFRSGVTICTINGSAHAGIKIFSGNGGGGIRVAGTDL